MLCPWCKSDVMPHCKNGHPTCKWVTCARCGYVIDPQERRAHDKHGQSVKWPYVGPERGAE